MIRRFTDKFIASESDVKAELAKAHPEDYDALVRRVIEIVTGDDNDYEHDQPDHERITVIDHGDYQGTRLYIIGAKGYEPSTYWSIFVDYGSCSGCDTLEAIRHYADDPPNAEQVQEYWTLMLHMAQSMCEVRQSADAVDPADGTSTK
jgi:hypothetical protein